MAADQRAQLFDAVYSNPVLVFEVEFFGLPVKDGVLPVIHINRPAQLKVQVLDQRRDAVNVAQLLGLGGERGGWRCHVVVSLMIATGLRAAKIPLRTPFSSGE